MNIIIEAPFNLSEGEKKMVKEKIADLGNYTKKISQAHVFFKEDDGSKPDVILAEVQLHVPGNEIFASEAKEDFMSAFIAAANKAKSQLLKRKDIRNDHYN